MSSRLMKNVFLFFLINAGHLSVSLSRTHTHVLSSKDLVCKLGKPSRLGKNEINFLVERREIGNLTLAELRDSEKIFSLFPFLFPSLSFCLFLPVHFSLNFQMYFSLYKVTSGKTGKLDQITDKKDTSFTFIRKYFPLLSIRRFNLSSFNKPVYVARII